jgi:hypothetical protein
VVRSAVDDMEGGGLLSEKTVYREYLLLETFLFSLPSPRQRTNVLWMFFYLLSNGLARAEQLSNFLLIGRSAVDDMEGGGLLSEQTVYSTPLISKLGEVRAG